MEEHLEPASNVELTAEDKAALNTIADEYERLAGSEAELLVATVVPEDRRTAAQTYLATLRLRKAAASKGLRIGV